MSIKPMHNNVLLKRVPIRESEIIIIPEAQKSWLHSVVRDRSDGRGLVLAVGPGRHSVDSRGLVKHQGQRQPMTAKVGDLVEFYEAGGDVTYLDDDQLMLPESAVRIILNETHPR